MNDDPDQGCAGDHPLHDREALLLHARLIGEEALRLLECGTGRALDLVAELERECDAAGSGIGRAWRLQIVGWSAASRDDVAQCRGCFDEATEVAEAEGDSYCLVKSLNGLANAYLMLNLFDRGLDTYRRALAIAQSLSSFPQLAAVIGSNIGATLHELGDHAGAVPYLEEALALGTSNQNNVAVLKSTLGFCLASLGRAEEAEALIKSAIEICVREGFAVTEAEVRDRYGGVLLSLGRAGEALDELAKATELAREIGSRSVEAEALVNRGKTLVRLGRSAAARRMLEKAVSLATQIDLATVLTSALGPLAEIRAHEGKWRSAYLLSVRKGKIEHEVFGRQVSIRTSALKSERAEAEAEAMGSLYRRLSTISEIGRAVAAATDVDSICRILYERISSLMPAEIFGVALYLADTDELDYRYFIDSGVVLEGKTRKVDAEVSLAGWCLRNCRELVLGDVPAEYRNYARSKMVLWADSKKGDIRSLIYYPIMVKDRPIAAITVQSRDYRQYEPYHVETLKALAAYVGIALENARLFEELRTLAVTDPLTQCMNRRRFIEILNAELVRSRRYGTRFAVIIFDLDHFKLVNDTYGHAAGDTILRNTVDVCKEVLRATDSLARYGGEEFVVCLPDTDLEGAAALAERFRRDLEASYVALPDGREIGITASFGIALAQGGILPEALLDRADASLYRAKERGRNRIELDAEGR